MNKDRFVAKKQEQKQKDLQIFSNSNHWGGIQAQQSLELDFQHNIFKGHATFLHFAQ